MIATDIFDEPRVRSRNTSGTSTTFAPTADNRNPVSI